MYPSSQLGDVIYANSGELCLLVFACASVVVSWVTNHRSHRILDWTIFLRECNSFFSFNVLSFCSDTCFLLVGYLIQNETSSSCSLLSLMGKRKHRRNKCFYCSGCLLWCGKTPSSDLKQKSQGKSSELLESSFGKGRVHSVLLYNTCYNTILRMPNMISAVNYGMLPSMRLKVRIWLLQPL